MSETSVIYKGQLYSVGDEVKSQYYRSEQNIVRKITRIDIDEMCGSGFRASANGGEKCKCCGVVTGRNIEEVDLGWFTKLSEPIE